jgi:hypothetical protein
MAYTFDEVFNSSVPFNPQTNEYYEVHTTVVITQEDGRTAHGADWLEINHTTHVLQRGINNADHAHDYYLRFSDRNRFQGNADQAGIQITAINNSILKITFTLKSWGNAQYSVEVDLVPNHPTFGKIYQGWGQTIGRGAGKAMHCMSFNDIHRAVVTIG